jgi:hypothetical protein
MSEHPVVPWEAVSREIVPHSARTPAEIAKRAVQLRPREISQIVSAFSAEHYEMASTYVWSKAITGLKRQLATLGSEFVGEMLQRPDIDSRTDVVAAVTPSEAIALAEDLGMVTRADAMRLRHAQESINHFADLDEEDSDDAESGMTPEEAIGCLRVCINSVLGQPKLEVARDFANFRRQLEEHSFKSSDREIEGLLESPYFFLKTTLSVLLALLKSSEGAQLQHAVRNTNLIVPLLWGRLRKPEKWQAGQTYAELHSGGKKDAVNGLKTALSKVSGFDYVPENLRSSTFTKAAKDVMEAHEGLNNYYTEPPAMEALASLGTAIPSPAFPICMSATLSVWLGNMYGYSWAAQNAATRILRGLSSERWKYYLEEVLPGDRGILYKLQHTRPAERWRSLLLAHDIQPKLVKDSQIARLIKAGRDAEFSALAKIAAQIFDRNL